MGVTYTSTIPLRVLKEHTCAACGNVYRYPMSRRIRRSSRRSAEDASRKARLAADRAVGWEVDTQPCPACGLVQPDMVGRRRGRAHKWVAWLGGLAAAALLVVRLADGFNAGPLTWALTGVAAAAAVAFAATEGLDPNRDPDANRRTAAARVSAGQVQADPNRRPVVRTLMTTDVPGRARAAWPLVGLAVLAPAAMAAPELWRMARHWPANPACFPPVVGPGDTTRVYMGRQVESIHGYYRGRADAALILGGGADDPIRLATRVNQNDWGSTITAKEGEKREHNRPWVELTMPADPALAGRAGEAAVRLDVEYPAPVAGENSFRTTEQVMEDRFPVRLAPAAAGRQYRALWWAATGAGFGLMVLAGVALIRAANGLRQPGTTTNVRPAP